MAKYMVTKAGNDGYIQALDGVLRKTLVHGDRTLMTEYRLEAGKALPMHRHPQEQTGYLVSGHIVLIIDGTPHEMRPGDCWSIPGDVEHGASIRENSVAVEVFSPVREDYLPG